MVNYHKGNGYRVRLILCGILFLGLVLNPSSVQGKSRAPENTKVLIVFSSKNGEIDEHQRLLDMLVSHFTTNIAFKNSLDMQEKDLDGVTQLFYYGQIEEQLPGSLLKIFQSYTGPFVAIGYNAEQLKSHFSFMKPGGVETISEVLLANKEAKKITVEPEDIMKITIDDKVDVLIEAKQGNNIFPLFVKQNKSYYYATNNLFPPMSNFLAEALHEVFEVKHQASTQAYLRLEDIHPGLDPNFVMEIARILKQKNIPYMVTVIPVYVNPETEEEYHFSDNPELLDALKYMQKNGGSIILHGYTDQYGKAETGEGFEFWNKEKNMPIYQNPGDTTVIKTRKDFGSQTDYEKYMKNKEAFETAYIENLLNKGINELVDYGLKPLAFEAPHYAMSQNGYNVISHYFSTYVGQIQLTDEDWRKMTESPYVSYPSFLHGMKLIPETIRYVRYEDPASIQEMKARVTDFTSVRDGVIGGFYHPFLGVKGLIDLVNDMEKIPHVEWIDLKEMNNTVKTKTVNIKTNKGKVLVHVKNEKRIPTSVAEIPIYLINLYRDNELWVFIGAGLTMLMTLISCVLLKRTQRIKRSLVGKVTNIHDR